MSILKAQKLGNINPKLCAVTLTCSAPDMFYSSYQNRGTFFKSILSAHNCLVVYKPKHHLSYTENSDSETAFVLLGLHLSCYAFCIFKNKVLARSANMASMTWLIYLRVKEDMD